MSTTTPPKKTTKSSAVAVPSDGVPQRKQVIRKPSPSRRSQSGKSEMNSPTSETEYDWQKPGNSPHQNLRRLVGGNVSLSRVFSLLNELNNQRD